MSRVVSYLYDDHAQATRAVAELESADFSSNEVSLVARAADGTLTNETGNHSGAITGAEIGGVAGAGAGILAALGVMAIPGIGPVVAAGMLATTLVTTTGGIVAGGLIGALTDYGVDSDDADVYAEGIRRGSSLVTVRTSDDRWQEADSILRRHAPVNTSDRRDEYVESGWRQAENEPDIRRATSETERPRSYR
jgi:hypothetical protein